MRGEWGKNGKIGKILIWLVVIVLIAVAVYVQNEIFRTGAPISFPNTHDTGISGYKAFYMLMSRIGFACSRNGRDMENLSGSGNSALVILSPYKEFIGEGDSSKIIDWARKGNSVFIAGNADNMLFGALNLSVVETGDSKKKTGGFQNLRGTLSRNVGSISGAGSMRFSPPDSRYFETLLRDDYGVICARIRYDRGHVTVFSCPGIFANGFIDKGDNSILATRLMNSLGKDLLEFDESFHGFSGFDRIFVLPPVAKVVILQLILALTVFFLVFMRRFGMSRKIEGSYSRSSNEYVRSFAGLFMRADSRNFLSENWIRGLKRRFSGRLGLTPDVSDERLIESAEGVSPGTGVRLAGLLEKCRRIGGKDRNGEEEMFRLCREMDSLNLDPVRRNR